MLPSESVAVIVKVLVPEAVGVPLIVIELAPPLWMVIPGIAFCRFDTDKVNGAVPPEVRTV